MSMMQRPSEASVRAPPDQQYIQESYQLPGQRCLAGKHNKRTYKQESPVLNLGFLREGAGNRIRTPYRTPQALALQGANTA